jgi:hypothetical protein
MMDGRLRVSKRCLLCATLGIAAASLCSLVLLFWFTNEQGQTEQRVVTSLLSKSPGGSACLDNRTTWLNRLCQALGIPRQVIDLSLQGNQINDDDLARLKSLRCLTSLSLDHCSITELSQISSWSSGKM